MQFYLGNNQKNLSTFLIQYKKATNLIHTRNQAILFPKRTIRTWIDLVIPDLRERMNERIWKNEYALIERFCHFDTW